MEKIYRTVHIATGQKSSMVAPSTAENRPKSMQVGVSEISIFTLTSQLIKMKNISIVSQGPSDNQIRIFIKYFFVLWLVPVNWGKSFRFKR